ncbi:MAG TPA: hypothetical protein VG754_07400 [Verrucomicrobiae bacterium]|nr:hypothetical protein [Verrucomicrobiae bacterium]
MRSLTQPKVLGRALVAALITSFACYPRLATWTERGASASFLWAVLLWAMFVLWGFVFAWHFQYSQRPVFGLEKFDPKLWAVASLVAIAAALFVHFNLDPKLRLLTPGTYPTDWNSWVAMGLFALAFEPLFLYFAPFAFFIRLMRRQDAALAMTVVFGLFVLALRINASPAPASVWLLVELVCLRVLGGFAGLYLYIKGGALLVWWVVIILHLRFLLDFAGAG